MLPDSFITIDIMENEYDTHYGYELSENPENFLCDNCRCLLFELAICDCNPIQTCNPYRRIDNILI